MTTSDDRHLFDERTDGTGKGHRDTVDSRSRVAMRAHELTIQFTPDDDLPARYRKSPARAPQRKMKMDSALARSFAATVQSWTQIIDTMLQKIDVQQAWRFISLSPAISSPLRKAIDCPDLCDFMDYFFLRRDIENCDVSELGGLAQLLTAFQAEVLKQLQPLQETQPHFDGSQ